MSVMLRRRARSGSLKAATFYLAERVIGLFRLLDRVVTAQLRISVYVQLC